VTDPETGSNRDAAYGRPKTRGLAFAHFAFLVALVPLLFVTGAMMATHVGYVDVDTGFRLLTLRIAPKLAMVALGIAGLSLLISLFKDHARYGLWALGAVILSGGVTAGFFVYERTLKSFPPIADVATDWDRPLTFSDSLIKDRGPKAMKVEDAPRVPRTQSMAWGGKTVAQINALTCPGAHPLIGKHLSEDQVADALTAAHYRVFGRAPWRVEGLYQDNFFGFKSDVVVRIDPDRIDVRSTGRDDLPDLGGNCRRVTDLVARLKAMPDQTQDQPAPAPAAGVSQSAAAPAQAPAGGGGGGGDD
jgi:fatty-acyl-CoA synthase